MFSVDAGAPLSRHHESAPETLGDILYSDKGTKHVPEEQWVSLVRAIAAGDQNALHTLYELTNRIVFTLIVRIASNRETAEEVTLDVFHEVWKNASRYNPDDGSVVGWIMNRARSRAIDRLRFEQRKKRRGNNQENPIGHTRNENPQDVYALGEQNRLLRGGLDVLTRDERQAIETAFFSELTYEETAASLQLPIGTVKTRIRSGLGKLRQKLAGVVESA